MESDSDCQDPHERQRCFKRERLFPNEEPHGKDGVYAGTLRENRIGLCGGGIGYVRKGHGQVQL